MNQIHALSLNSSGIKSKIASINTYLLSTVYDLILIQETWLDESIDSSVLVRDTNFSIIRKDRSASLNLRSRGGGTTISLRNCLKYQDITPNYPTIAEFTATRLLTNPSIIIVNAYVPPYEKSAAYREISDFSTEERTRSKMLPLIWIAFTMK